MADDSPPAAKRQKQEAVPTTIYSLSEDLLLRIFLCLPSLATLIRAALTCRAWRCMVASSPSFCRRFREIHPTPLLGFFFDAPTVIKCPDFPAFPFFVPVCHCDHDIAAAIRGGDFFLTSIQEHPDKIQCWGISNCCSGYILLSNGGDVAHRPMALLNPLVRRGVRFLDDGHKNTYEGFYGRLMEHNACLVFSDEEPSSFKVVRLFYDESKVRATVFSSDTDDWSIGPWVDVTAQPTRSRGWLLTSNMLVNGFLYWDYKNHKYLVTFDTATMKFSMQELPQLLRNKHCSFKIGETSSGIPYIFYAIGFNVGVFLRRTDDSDGVERWMLDWDTSFETQLRELFQVVLNNYNDLVVVEVRDGFVYLALSRKAHQEQIPGWFFTLYLKMMKLEKLFERSYDSVGHPYVMAWPPSLVGNFGRFALEYDA